MNCQEFETLSIDLARERLMDADARTRGLAHADDCTRCAARLADERALNVGLQAFAAASTETANAPAHLEEALLSAFRARAGGVVTTPATVMQSRIVADATRRRWMPRAVGAAAAAAAALLLTFGIVAPHWHANDALQQQQASTQDARQQQQASTQTDKPLTASPVALSPVEQSSLSPSPVAILVEPPVSNENFSTQASVALTRTKDTMRQPVRRNVAAASRDSVAPRSGRGGGLASESELAANSGASVAPSNAAASNVAAGDAEVEIATEFMPLVPGGTSGTTDGGQLVRVELPRSALVSMGLPLNVESSSERVKADVLLGEDGLARAIRFVR